MCSEPAETDAAASATATTSSAATAAATKADPDAGLSAGDQAAALTPLLALQINALRNIRYHEDRQGFFEAASRWSNFFVVVAGSGAAASGFAHHPRVAATAGAASAVLGAGQLVFDLAGKARTHLELRKAFVRILAAAKRPDPDLVAVEVEMIELYKDEPEVYYAVDALAYNAAMGLAGRPRDRGVIVSHWQRIFRHVRRFDPAAFPDIIRPSF